MRPGMMKKYKISFDAWGLLLFLLIMAPNLIWFAVPAPNDILRGESATEFLDTIASVCQVLLVAALCVIVNRERTALRLTPVICGCVGSGVIYYAGWILYYLGFNNSSVILLLTVPPCLAFLLFAIDRKNVVAAVPAVIFTICHLICGIVNFIIC